MVLCLILACLPCSLDPEIVDSGSSVPLSSDCLAKDSPIVNKLEYAPKPAEANRSSDEISVYASLLSPLSRSKLSRHVSVFKIIMGRIENVTVVMRTEDYDSEIAYITGPHPLQKNSTYNPLSVYNE
ncbi:hypothetical protein HUJ05_007840 [Dendroctonus ponderosae]|nr:hypothetical protein HUJ05_007840 [Dendroctonus ponderosae]